MHSDILHEMPDMSSSPAYSANTEEATDPLQWRHNGRDSVSNHQPHNCLLYHLFWRRSKKTSKLRVTGLCARNSPGPVNSPHKWPVTRKRFPFDDIIMHLRQIWLSWGLESPRTATNVRSIQHVIPGEAILPSCPFAGYGRLTRCGLKLFRKWQLCIFYNFSTLRRWRKLKSYFIGSKDLLILWKQYHGCWWPGDARSQDIKGHDTKYLDYSDLSIRVDLSPPGQKGRHFADIFKSISMNEKFCILILISLKFLPKDLIDNKSELVHVKAWHRTGDKPLHF